MTSEAGWGSAQGSPPYTLSGVQFYLDGVMLHQTTGRGINVLDINRTTGESDLGLDVGNALMGRIINRIALLAKQGGNAFVSIRPSIRLEYNFYIPEWNILKECEVSADSAAADSADSVADSKLLE